VAHAHSKGIIHRDLKPENVMIDSEGDVFVMDFGLARAVEETGLTQPGMIMGTPFFMSPEQLRGEKLDERSDIYSIGLILYYCMTGDELFRADSVTAVMAKHATSQIRDVVAMQSLLPSNLQDVLVSMLEEERNMRTRSVKEVLERLTLRKIVALGLAATQEQPVSDDTATVAFATPERMEEEAIPPESPQLVAAAERRKARMRSLLDSL
jgi:serine/threonine-protein kinase